MRAWQTAMCLHISISIAAAAAAIPNAECNNQNNFWGNDITWYYDCATGQHSTTGCPSGATCANVRCANVGSCCSGDSLDARGALWCGGQHVCEPIEIEGDTTVNAFCSAPALPVGAAVILASVVVLVGASAAARHRRRDAAGSIH